MNTKFLSALLASAILLPVSGFAATTGLVEAHGVINASGQKLSGTPNWTASYDSVNKWYAITLVNETYIAGSYTAVVTPMGTTLSGNPAMDCKTDSSAGKLVVACFDKTQAKVPSIFSFIVLKY